MRKISARLCAIHNSGFRLSNRLAHNLTLTQTIETSIIHRICYCS